MPMNLPDGYHSVNPYIVATDARALMAFLAEAFGATPHELIESSDGAVNHAEVRIGDCLVMLTQAMPEFPATPCHHYLYLDDVDATYRRALAAGATSVREPEDQYYGDRVAGVTDQGGNTWWLATHLEDVAPDELRRRHAAREAQPT
jgi:uncharacterized glyoxalase superfamily protein PhnB